MDVLAASSSKDVTLQFDVGTCVEAGQDPVAWINANPGRIRSVHCKDWGAGQGRGYSVAFGEGDCPWLKIFEAAEKTGGVQYYLIEQERSAPGPAIPDVRTLHDELEKTQGVKDQGDLSFVINHSPYVICGTDNRLRSAMTFGV